MTATPDLLFMTAVAPMTFEAFRRLPSAMRNNKSRSLWVFLVVFDAVLALRISAVSGFIHRTTGLGDAVILFRLILSFGAVAALIQLVLVVVPGRMDGQREPSYRRIISNRPRRIATWVTVCTSTILFPMAVQSSDTRGNGEYIFLQAGHVWGSLHLLLFYAYMAFGTICATLMLSAASRDQKSSGAFKIGLQSMTIGCSFGAMYAIVRAGYLVTRLSGKPFLGGDGFVGTFSCFALAGFALLVLGGASAPMWERMSVRMERHAAVNDLRSMWTSLTYAVPAVVYRSGREQWFIRVVAPRAPKMAKVFCRVFRAAVDFWNWRGLERRLHRRVTEICDAAIRLQAYLPEDMHDESVATAQELGLAEYTVPAYLLHTAMYLKKTGFEPQAHNPCRPILEPADDPLATTAILLPIGKVMANPVLMGRFHRRRRESV